YFRFRSKEGDALRDCRQLLPVAGDIDNPLGIARGSSPGKAAKHKGLEAVRHMGDDDVAAGKKLGQSIVVRHHQSQTPRIWPLSDPAAADRYAPAASPIL